MKYTREQFAELYANKSREQAISSLKRDYVLHSRRHHSTENQQCARWCLDILAERFQDYELSANASAISDVDWNMQLKALLSSVTPIYVKE